MKLKNALMALALVAASAPTKAQTAVFNRFSYQGNDARFAQTIDTTRQFFNPIIAGFAPDPSICRKGDTYYMVNSTFTLFPGVPLYTSKNLREWTLVGHVLDRESQLPLHGQHVSGGIYAPAISYNQRNNTFYMITTNVGKGNFYVKSTNPEQGWSEPIYLKGLGGIDPSFFFDKDGKGYIVHNDVPNGGPRYEGERSIWIRQFDVKGDSMMGTPKEILRSGTHVQENPIWIEGPHLYRIGKYYYLMCAEGGTGAWHSEVILRAKNPMGPWEEFTEGNPILTQRSGLDPMRPHPVSSTGHADLVQTPKGDWWAVFLGCRPYEDDWYNTGRDTYMLPVTWKDGWPTILPKGEVLPTVVDAAKEYAPAPRTAENLLTGNFGYTDEFKGEKLNSRWYFLREPAPFYQLAADGLHISPMNTHARGRKAFSALFCKQQHTTFSASTTLRFVPQCGQDLAGMLLFQNEDYQIVLGKTMLNGRPAVVVQRVEKTAVNIASAFLCEQDAAAPLQLKVEGKGRYYDFHYAVGNGGWQLLAQGVDALNLSTNRAGGFIGTLIGLYATRQAAGKH